MNCPPVLLIAYRRPSTTRKVIDAIRSVKAPQVFFSANGPNPKLNERAICDEVRGVIDEIDWDCKVHTNFREDHLPAKESIVSSIDWFFSQVESGVILEDDCVPSGSFFDFASEMLERYRDNPSVRHISANCHANGSDPSVSYHFSAYPHIWGWATWSAAWEAYQETLETLSRPQLQELAADRGLDQGEQLYWLYVYDYVRSGNLDTWDYDWVFSIWAAEGVCVTPGENLVENIGFGDGATNTLNAGAGSDLKANELEFPLNHPAEIKIDREADRRVADEFYGITKSYRFKHLKSRLSRRVPIPLKRWLKKRCS